MYRDQPQTGWPPAAARRIGTCAMPSSSKSAPSRVEAEPAVPARRAGAGRRARRRGRARAARPGRARAPSAGRRCRPSAPAARWRPGRSAPTRPASSSSRSVAIGVAVALGPDQPGRRFEVAPVQFAVGAGLLDDEDVDPQGEQPVQRDRIDLADGRVANGDGAARHRARSAATISSRRRAWVRAESPAPRSLSAWLAAGVDAAEVGAHLRQAPTASARPATEVAAGVAAPPAPSSSGRTRAFAGSTCRPSASTGGPSRSRP